MILWLNLQGVLTCVRDTQWNIYRWNGMSGICFILNDMSGVSGQKGEGRDADGTRWPHTDHC